MIDLIKNYSNIIVPIIIGAILNYHFNKKLTKINNHFNVTLEEYKSKLEKYRLEINLIKDRRLSLTQTQKDILFIVQNTLNKSYSSNDDIIKRIHQLIIDTKNQEIDRGKNLNPLFKLHNAIGINVFSEKVMAIRLDLQEQSYLSTEANNFELLVSYSLLYKYLYLDFSGIEIDDFYLLRYYLNDFNENILNFQNARLEINRRLQKKVL